MFNNMGRKIKVLAKILCWIGIIASAVFGFLFGTKDDETLSLIIGIAIIIFGTLFSWIGSFLLYGFGQLVENSDILVQNSDRMLELRQRAMQNKNIR